MKLAPKEGDSPVNSFCIFVYRTYRMSFALQDFGFSLFLKDITPLFRGNQTGGCTIAPTFTKNF